MKEATLYNKEQLKHGNTLFPIKMYYTVLKRPLKDLYLHWHEELEIIHIKGGSGIFHLDLQKFEVTSETFLIVSPKMLHSGFSHDYLDCETLVFDLHTLLSQNTVIQDIDYIQPILAGQVVVKQCITKNDKQFDDLKNLFSQIRSTVDTHKTGYELLTKAYLFQLIHLFYASDLTSISTRKNTFDKKLERLASILDYVEKHFDEDISVADISSYIGVSEYYFCHFFKVMTDSTFKNYLNRYRIQEACELLLTSDKEIIDIATECSFDNLSYFYRQFKRQKGISPGAFRKSNSQ